MYRTPSLHPLDSTVLIACCSSSAGGSCGAPPPPPPGCGDAISNLLCKFG